jgi:putative transposase
MSRRPRRPPFVQGHFYHIYNRGVHGEPIIREDENYFYVIDRMKRYGREFDLTIIAYCLMPNHYHFLIRQDSEHRVGLLPQRVFNSYTKAYNIRYGHSGTLFEGPYKAVQVMKDSHLRHLCRYIHANPVKDGLVKSIEDWPFSNYLDWIGKRQGTLVDIAFVEGMFRNAAEYQEFVQDFLIMRELPKELVEYFEG